MISKYPGRCKGCGKAYKVGEDIYWTKEEGAFCWACRESPPVTAADLIAMNALADRLGFNKSEQA